MKINLTERGVEFLAEDLIDEEKLGRVITAIADGDMVISGAPLHIEFITNDPDTE